MYMYMLVHIHARTRRATHTYIYIYVYVLAETCVIDEKTIGVTKAIEKGLNNRFACSFYVPFSSFPMF